MDGPNGRGALFGWLALRFGIDLHDQLPSLVLWTADRAVPVPWGEIVGTLAVLATPVATGLWLLTTHTGRAAAQWQPHLNRRQAALVAVLVAAVLLSLLPWSLPGRAAQ
jgi:hypothetical protein